MDAPYTVLARRFRPQTFGEVVGQERVSQTLRNAILEGRVAHAYLFTGARGVGKTSMARIFAKALNCPHAVDAVPCNQCETCQGIAAGQDVDVAEIDGASNRGIDDIRMLRANVNVKSMRSKFKVYIIDEVHMLTKEAFNALLKTLEEPPPGVKFVFCTTEPNKLPDTILSRCQRFDFGVIACDQIAERLRQLASAEGYEVAEDAIQLVARRAAGSMRDSQSLFDQLLAFGEKQITTADVHRILGTASDDRLIAIMDAVVQRRPADALHRLDEELAAGVQLEPLLDQLIGYLRDLLMHAAGAGDLPLVSVGAAGREAVAAHASNWGVSTVTAALQILADAKGRMGRVTFGRVLAELALVRMASLADLDRLDDLIGRLQSAAATGTTATTARPLAPPAVLTPRLASEKPLQRESVDRASTPTLPEAPPSHSSQVDAPQPARPSQFQAPLAPPPRNESPSPIVRPAVPSERREKEPSPPVSAAQPNSPASPPNRSNSPDAPFVDAEPEYEGPLPLDSELIDSPQNRKDLASSPGFGAPLVATQPESPLETPPPGRFAKEQESAIRERLIAGADPITAAHLSKSVSIAITGPNRLEIIFPAGYDLGKRACEQSDVQSALSEIVRVFTGVSPRIDVRLSSIVTTQTVPRKDVTQKPPMGRRTLETTGDALTDEIGRVLGIKSWVPQTITSSADTDSSD